MSERRALGAATLAAVLGLASATCGGGAEGAGTSPCGTPDVGNHDLGHAAAFGVGSEQTGCLEPSARPDVYSFQLEDGAQAGYLSFRLDGAALGRPTATLYGASGDATFATVAADPGGAPMAFVVAVSPGTSYRLAIADDGSATAPYPYQLSATYAPVADMFEPNDQLGEATPIAAATPIDAYLFAGASAPNTDLEAYDDFYRVPLTGGQTVSVRLESVPTDLAPRLFIYDGLGSELGRIVNGHKGETITLQLQTPVAGGDYSVRVGLWTETPETMSPQSALPDHFTRPYRLTVSQP